MILEIEGENTRSHSVENSPWKRLWTCCKADYGTMMTELYTTRWHQGLRISFSAVYYLGYGVEDQGILVTLLETASFFSPNHLDWFCGPPTLLFSGCRDVRLATELHLLPSLKMREFIPPLHHSLSCSAREKITSAKFKIPTKMLLKIQVFWSISHVL